MGSLSAFTIGPDGVLIGIFCNGLKQPVAQIALANFTNPPGWRRSAARSTAPRSTPARRRSAPPGPAAAARSPAARWRCRNVDLAAEFTNLIVAQRGFQANSRVITSSDEMLQDLVNLKR